jgi:hypothetical protein
VANLVDCNYFHSDLPFRIARALSPYCSTPPEANAESVPLLATGAIWVLFAVVLEDSKRAQLAAALTISSALATTHVVPNAGEVVEFLVPWIGKKAAVHDSVDVRLDFSAMVAALSFAPGWATSDDSWVKAFKKAGGPRVLAQLVDAARLLADSSPRNVIELIVVLGCVRALSHGVQELGKTFVRDGGLPARLMQCLVPEASAHLIATTVLHCADPFAQLKASCVEFVENADVMTLLLDVLADPLAMPGDTIMRTLHAFNNAAAAAALVHSNPDASASSLPPPPLPAVLSSGMPSAAAAAGVVVAPPPPPPPPPPRPALPDRQQKPVDERSVARKLSLCAYARVLITCRSGSGERCTAAGRVEQRGACARAARRCAAAGRGCGHARTTARERIRRADDGGERARRVGAGRRLAQPVSRVRVR